jgi:hypothetical protein
MPPAADISSAPLRCITMIALSTIATLITPANITACRRLRLHWHWVIFSLAVPLPGHAIIRQRRYWK